MKQDHHEITVHTMYPIHGMGPVFYASMPGADGSLNRCRAEGAGDKRILLSTLWDHLSAMGSPLWRHCLSSNKAAFSIQVARGLLGRPHLMLGQARGPAISFSEGGGKLWAGLCGEEFDIGIDAADTDDFQREYPFHRVFHPQELQHALRLVGGDLESASGLLWSVKEAVVKALGCGFHLVDPMQITVHPSAEGTPRWASWYTFPVELSVKARVRLHIAAGRSVWAGSLPQEKMWLSIALFGRQH